MQSVSFDPDHLSQIVLRLSSSSLPVSSKLEQMLQLISEAFHPDRCLILTPEAEAKEGPIGRLLSEKEPLWVSDASSFQSERGLSEGSVLPAFTWLPLFDETSFLGGLYLGFSEKRAFPPEEVDWLTLVARVIRDLILNHRIRIKADESSEKARAQETRAGQLATLFELDRTLLATIDFERILHRALTIITHGEGLRFNRAMLFLVNERKKILEGIMAVGPDSPEEAGKVWDALSSKKGIPLDMINQLPPSPPETSVLYSFVKGIQIPLERKGCFLVRTALEERAFNVQFPEHGECCNLSSEAGCPIGERMGRHNQAYSFATVPVMGKGKAIGVVSVDNIYNQRSIEDDEIQFLSMFSSKVGLAIENAGLYRHLATAHEELRKAQDRLIHREKMVALGELCSSIAHEIKNPLVSIGGFARRLYRSIPEEAPEKRYTQTIIIEVARIEKILNDVTQYTNGEHLTLKECDLKTLIEDSLSMISEDFTDDIHLVREYAEDLPEVTGDDQQLKQAFFNLIANAYQSINGHGVIIVRAYPLSADHSCWVRVEVEDNGAGIDPKDLHHIFNPFHTTKESGPGLGLAIVHKVVTSHGGQIEVDNKPTKGVRFIITLPARRGDQGERKALP